MIRSKDKIYAEVSPENNVISKTPFKGGKLLEKSAEFELAEIEVKPNTIPYYRVNNKGLALNTPNRIVGTDQNGDLTLFERIVLPATPPTKRVEYEFIPGEKNTMIDVTVTLEGPYWYEIELASPGGGGGAGVFGSGVSQSTKAGNGAIGTYFRTQLKVEKTRQMTVKIGTPGTGGLGGTFVYTGKDVTVTGEVSGGRGGKTPILAERYPTPSYAPEATLNVMDGKYFPWGISKPVEPLVPGGKGYNQGSPGGYSQVGTPTNNGATASGGGSNGQYGGVGGSYYGSGGNASLFYAGCGGGAGGGFNIGGYGGLPTGLYADLYHDPQFPRTLITPSAYALAHADKPGNYSEGGGGGGTAAIDRRGGSGGGGGGGVYILSGDFELLVGGGGGGYGAGRATTYNCIEATQGTSSMVSMAYHPNRPRVVIPGEGSIGWRGDSSELVTIEGATTNTNGLSGKPGAVIIYRLED